MAGGVNTDIRRDEDIVPNCDLRAVENDEVNVRVEVVPDLDVVAVVALERRLDPEVLADFP